MNRPKHLLIWFAVALQVLCALVFLENLASSVLGLRTTPRPWQLVELLEISASIGLIVGAVIGIRALIRARAESERADQAIRIASGAFAHVIDDHLDAWRVTPTEREVAWLMIKGFSTAEIATLRGKSEGTIKAQTNAIYRKAGVSGRAQLLALLVEDLLAPNETV